MIILAMPPRGRVICRDRRRAPRIPVLALLSLLAAGCGLTTEGSLVENRAGMPDASSGDPPGGGPCGPGYADCDLDRSNGCETNRMADPRNCGACGYACPANGGTAVCRGGTCAISSCTAGLDDCDGNPDDCETSVTTSVDNCGFCGNVCTFANASATCANGVCQLAACNDGYADCDQNPSNGCETDLGTDPLHCGTCARACSFPHAAAECVGGVCQRGACESPFDDCNQDPGDGCETDPMTNVGHCGGCGHKCETGSNPRGVLTCVGGVCGITCDTLFGVPTFGDCNHDLADGCETNLQTSTTHCQSCGNACAGTLVANAFPACHPQLVPLVPWCGADCKAGYDGCYKLGFLTECVPHGRDCGW